MRSMGERLRVKSLWVKSTWVKSLWVKNLLGKIGVSGMLALVSPFSGLPLNPHKSRFSDAWIDGIDQLRFVHGHDFKINMTVPCQPPSMGDETWR